MKRREDYEDYVRKAVARNVGPMQESKIFLALFTQDYVKDSLALLQLGMAVAMGKPIYLLMKRGTPLNDNVRRLARAIEEFVSEDDIGLATARLMQRIEAPPGKPRT